MAVKKTTKKADVSATPTKPEVKDTPKPKAAKKVAAPKAAEPEAAKKETPEPAKAAPAKKAAAPATKAAAAAIKLTPPQTELLKKIGEAAEPGYTAEKKAEQATIDRLADKKLVRKGAKNKESGKVPYTLTVAGKKHIG